MLKNNCIWLGLLGTNLVLAQSSFKENLDIDGNTIVESYVFFQSIRGKEDTQNEWKTNFDLNYKFSNTIQLKSSTQINLNTIEEERRFIELRELYLNFRTGKFTTALGRQIVDWSGLAGWSAGDIPNTFQFYDFLDTEDEERGQWALKGSFQHRNTQLSATVIPIYRVSKLFLENSRWVNLPTETEISTTAVPLNFIDSNEINRYDELQLGVKLSTTIGTTQQTILAYHGYNDIPVRRLNITDQNPTDGLDYTLELIYHKLQYVSWQSEFYLGQWNLWTEANLTKTRILEEDTLTSHIFYNLLLGTDRSFEFNDPEKQLNLLVQYIYSFNTEDVNYAANDLDHIFNNAVVMRIEYQLNYRLETEIRAAFEFQKKGYYINPKLEYSILDNLKFLVAADILFGKRQSFFGNFQDNTRGRIAINYLF